MFPGPMTLSINDMDKIRSILMKAIEESMKVVKTSPPEVLTCLNIDWFKICHPMKR